MLFSPKGHNKKCVYVCVCECLIRAICSHYALRRVSARAELSVLLARALISIDLAGRLEL